MCDSVNNSDDNVFSSLMQMYKYLDDINDIPSELKKCDTENDTNNLQHNPDEIVKKIDKIYTTVAIINKKMLLKEQMLANIKKSIDKIKETKETKETNKQESDFDIIKNNINDINKRIEYTNNINTGITIGVSIGLIVFVITNKYFSGKN